MESLTSSFKVEGGSVEGDIPQSSKQYLKTRIVSLSEREKTVNLILNEVYSSWIYDQIRGRQVPWYGCFGPNFKHWCWCNWQTLAQSSQGKSWKCFFTSKFKVHRPLKRFYCFLRSSPVFLRVWLGRVSWEVITVHDFLIYLNKVHILLEGRKN